MSFLPEISSLLPQNRQPLNAHSRTTSVPRTATVDAPTNFQRRRFSNPPSLTSTSEASLNADNDQKYPKNHSSLARATSGSRGALNGRLRSMSVNPVGSSSTTLHISDEQHSRSKGSSSSSMLSGLSHGHSPSFSTSSIHDTTLGIRGGPDEANGFVGYSRQDFCVLKRLNLSTSLSIGGGGGVDLFRETYLAALCRDVDELNKQQNKPGGLATEGEALPSVPVKHELVRLRAIQRVRKQRDFLRHVTGHIPFLLSYLCSFQDSLCINMVVEYTPASLQSYIRAREVTLSEEVTRFYLAELVVAMEFLHQNHIVMLGLATETIMVDPAGHLKLYDFSYAMTGVDSKSGMMVDRVVLGVTGYICPEGLREGFVSQLSDWWSFGVVGYEMLLGQIPDGRVRHDTILERPPDPGRVVEQPPSTSVSGGRRNSSFSSDTNLSKSSRQRSQSRSKITAIGFTFDHLSVPARDFLSRILHPDPKRRLGSWHGSEDIKCHLFFRNNVGLTHPVQWRQVAQLKWMSPPIVPIQGGVVEGDQEILELIDHARLDPWGTYASGSMGSQESVASGSRNIGRAKCSEDMGDDLFSDFSY
ncbi:kinase-like domain-containing protein [Cladochytrium replicatum]|nr:kinase-like domain-containing protein [Cladochytrium replicatum]